MTAEDRAAAHQLTREGDRAYRAGNFAKAFTAYSNAYPNAPTAYAYLMAGDAHWRDVYRYNQRKMPLEHEGCPLKNTFFAHDLARDLNQQQDVALSLTSNAFGGPPLSAALLTRAREETSCLHALAQQYQAAPPSACVDMAKLRDCLGDTLIK